MTITTTRYLRKPFYIDAIQVTVANMEEVAAWCQGEIRVEDADGRTDTPVEYIHVRVFRPLNDKQSKAYVGNWVLYAGTGFKVYTDKAFKNCFVQEENKEAKGMNTTDAAVKGIENDALVAAAKPSL